MLFMSRAQEAINKECVISSLQTGFFLLSRFIAFYSRADHKYSV